MTEMTDTPEHDKVWELIKDVHIALLVTHGDDDILHARPMAVLNKTFDGTLWFFTKADSPKIEEIAKNNKVLLSYSNPSKQEYVSVQGNAEVLNDRSKIEELWSEPLRIWFPKGKDDATIRVIRIDVTHAEYWDSPSSALVMIYGYTKARLTGEVPKIGEHKKVAFS